MKKLEWLSSFWWTTARTRKTRPLKRGRSKKISVYSMLLSEKRWMQGNHKSPESQRQQVQCRPPTPGISNRQSLILLFKIRRSSLITLAKISRIVFLRNRQILVEQAPPYKLKDLSKKKSLSNAPWHRRSICLVTLNQRPLDQFQSIWKRNRRQLKRANQYQSSTSTKTSQRYLIKNLIRKKEGPFCWNLEAKLSWQKATWLCRWKLRKSKERQLGRKNRSRTRV